MSDNNKDLKSNEEIESVLNDDDIRNWFLSRDPDRKKVNPFIDEEAAEMYRGQASSLTPAEEKSNDKVYGISFSQHERHIKNVSKYFTFFGIAIGLIIAIIIAIVL